MKKSWGRFFRRVATACSLAIAGSSAWQSAVCYAAAALDTASDPVYADGWNGVTHAGTAGGGAQLTSGDNGGFGFTAWNFDSGYIASGNYTQPHGYNYGNYAAVGTKDIQPGGGFNALGTAWTIRSVAQQGAGAVRAGRGFNLGVGETLRVTVDNPGVDPAYFKGFFVQLMGGTGGVNGNSANGHGGHSHGSTVGADPKVKMRYQVFNFGANPNNWKVVDSGATLDTGLNIAQTAASGAIFSVTRTGVETYDTSLDSLATPGVDFSTAGRTFDNAGANVDWIEFVFFTNDTDPALATDMYVSRMEIVPEPASGVLAAAAGLGLLAARRRKT